MATGAFEHLYAADVDQWACRTYERNLGRQADVRDLSELVLEADSWAADLRSKALCHWFYLAARLAKASRLT